jgi:hypothetical protein
MNYRALGSGHVYLFEQLYQESFHGLKIQAGWCKQEMRYEFFIWRHLSRRPTRRYEGNIKIYLGEMAYDDMYWIQLAQGCDW